MDPLIRALMRPDAYDHPVADLQLLETHISWVILTGEFAYKLKKPVDFGFVNFTTLERRRCFCDEEIRLNQRLAPELYLGVRPVFGPRERATLVGPGDVIEYAVQMRQFDQAQLLPAVLQRGELQTRQIDDLARTIAAFHRNAAVAGVETEFGTPDAVRAPAIANLDVLDRRPEHQRTLAALRSWTEAEWLRRRDWFAERRTLGRVRECHGDMHLGNMVLLQHNRVCIFDCLEFNPRLRWTDVIAEVAFLVMDLAERGRPDFAQRLLNRWLEQTGDYAGLAGWRWYLVYRALVRAKVAALRLEQSDLSDVERAAKTDELQQYLQLANAWAGRRPRAVLVMHGVSGSGKSYVAERICEQFGAVRLRSDVERKRLFQQWGDPCPLVLTGDMYSGQATNVVYRERLASLVPLVLEGGFPVVIDATCLHHWQRELFRELATQHNVPWCLIDLQAQPETLRQRIALRQAAGDDPSDADLSVLEHQLATREPLTPDERNHAMAVDTDAADWWPSLESALRQRLL